MFKVVTIGAASRDIEKVRALLRSLPSVTGCVFLFVQYSDVIDDGITAEMLSEHSRLVVGHAVDGAAMEADHLYIAPKGCFMRIEGGVIRLTPPRGEHPFDFLVQAVAVEFGPYAVAVLLSAGDGARAVDISEAGGLVLSDRIQFANRGSTQHDSAINAGELDCLTIAQIADRIVNHSPVTGKIMSGERTMGEVVRNLEIAADEHRINSAEAQPLNEAYRYANKVPIETKRELQTRNEDLEVRNHQLQESLDKQHDVARNLRHILLNIDLPMVFLDADLKIRFLTPAMRLLFNVTAIDIGRPLSDVGVLADDLHLHADAVAARDTGVCSDKEIAALNGHWYIRRITPYQRGGEHSEGVVITFIDTSVQRQIAEDREAAKRSAELAVEAKALFLAAASHDLRQPLQTLKLLHGLLEESVENDQSRLFVKRMEDTLASMSSILDTVLDGNQIETGMARPKPVAAILVIEEEKGMRDLLSIGLEQVGHIVTATASAAEALSIVQSGKFAPDAILADVNLAEGMDGVTTIAELRRSLGCHIPALVLTGNNSSQTFRKYAQHDILHLNKSTRLRDIIDAIDDLLAHRSERRAVQKSEPVRRRIDDDSDKLIELIDDDQGIRDSVESFFRGTGWSVVTYVSAEEYLSLYSGDRASCLMANAHLPGMGGLELLRILKARGHRFPVIVITGHSDVRMAVKAIKQGAADFIERPLSAQETQASVREAGGLSHGRHQRSQQQEEAQQILAHLTRRQHQILERIVAGQPNKIIAAEMDISQRTVENHRASIMRRTGSTSFPALLRLVAWAEE